MLEVLKFVLSGFCPFFGTLALIVTIGLAGAMIVAPIAAMFRNDNQQAGGD